MKLSNKTDQSVTFDITSANGREIDAVLSSGEARIVDLTAYLGPFGLVVRVAENSQTRVGVDGNATVTATGDIAFEVNVVSEETSSTN